MLFKIYLLLLHILNEQRHSKEYNWYLVQILLQLISFFYHGKIIIQTEYKGTRKLKYTRNFINLSELLCYLLLEEISKSDIEK